MPDSIPLCEAERRLASLVEDVAQGREFLIAKDGVPVARIAPLRRKAPSKPSSLWAVTRIADDFEAPDDEVNRLFEGRL